MALEGGRCNPKGCARPRPRPYALGMGWDDPDIGEGLDPDGPSAEDLDRFGDEFITCPACRRPIYDQAELCPHCGHAIMQTQAPLKLWVILVAAVVLAAFVFFLVR